MRILFTVHKFPPESLGGTENYAWSLGRILAEQGHDVHVFYPFPELPPSQAYIERDGMHLWRVPVPADPGGPVAEFWHSVRNRTIEAEFDKIYERLQPDIVHFQHLQNVSARLIAMAASTPSLITLQDYFYFCANGQLIRPDRSVCGGPQLGWNCVDCAAHRAGQEWITALRPFVALPFAARNAYLRTLAQEIDRFIAPSEFLRQQYIANGFPAERIQTLEYGLDTDRIEPTPSQNDAPKAVHGAELSAGEEAGDGLHFGFLGSIVWQKGVHVLVDAFNQLPPNVRLTIHGSEAAYPEYGRELREKVQHPGVRFGGPLHHAQVGAALQNFDCLIVPSVWYENSPLVIQEAYGAGIPVIASRLGSMPEKVREGETGWLFAPGDGADLARVIRSLMDEPAQIQRMKAHVHPAPSMRQHAQDMLEIYSELLGQNR